MSSHYTFVTFDFLRHINTPTHSVTHTPPHYIEQRVYGVQEQVLTKLDNNALVMVGSCNNVTEG